MLIRRIRSPGAWRRSGCQSETTFHQAFRPRCPGGGGFIGLGGIYLLIVASDPELSFGIQRLPGGPVFLLGLVLVVVAGAELFAGNNLMAMAAWVSRKIPTARLIRNLAIVYCANFIGAAGLDRRVVGISRNERRRDRQNGVEHRTVESLHGIYRGISQRCPL